VVLCQSQEDAENAKIRANQFLNQRGLSLSEEKTKITHISKGFDYLGFNIRLYKDKSRKSGNILLIKPSMQSVQGIKSKLKEIWLKGRGKPLEYILTRIPPVVRGWANYFSRVVSTETFNYLDDWMFKREVRYVKRKHPNKSKIWTQAKYWGNLNPDYPNQKWVFGDKTTGTHIPHFAWTKIVRHSKIAHDYSPDNPDPQVQEAFAKPSKGKVNGLSKQKRELAKTQKCRCSHCGQSLFNGEPYQVHHIIPRKQGGSDKLSNLVLLHRDCHLATHHDKH